MGLPVERYPLALAFSVTIVRPPGSFAAMRAPMPSRLSFPGDPFRRRRR